MSKLTNLPEALPSVTRCIQTACGELFLHTATFDGEIQWVSANMGKSGTCAKCHIDTHMSLLSGLFKHCDKATRLKIFNEASGHICGIGGKTGTCMDLVLRYLIDRELADYDEQEEDV